jgi:hypothetical protein
LSTCRPRNLVVSTSTVLSTNPILRLTQFLLVVQNFMKFVLSKCDVSLLALIHLFKPAKTSLMHIWKQSISGCVIIIFVSSAKSIGLDWELMVGGRSLTYMRESRGPSIEPCTPCFIMPQFE